MLRSSKASTWRRAQSGTCKIWHLVLLPLNYPTNALRFSPLILSDPAVETPIAAREENTFWCLCYPTGNSVSVNCLVTVTMHLSVCTLPHFHFRDKELQHPALIIRCLLILFCFPSMQKMLLTPICNPVKINWSYIIFSPDCFMMHHFRFMAFKSHMTWHCLGFISLIIFNNVVISVRTVACFSALTSETVHALMCFNH